MLGDVNQSVIATNSYLARKSGTNAAGIFVLQSGSVATGADWRLRRALAFDVASQLV